MAEVGAVYDATPAPRTPADILPGNDTQRRDATAAPTARNKWLTASVVDGADLGHPLAASFLAFGQSGRQFRVGRRGGLGGRRAQCTGAHHDALAVTGQHQDGADLAGGCLP